MCTVVILRRPDQDWPTIVGANRDEMHHRPWQPPARHWRDRRDVLAGRDELAGGSWLGLNDDGVLAAVLNRTGELGPSSEKRSRGELVLEALDHADARTAAEALSTLDARAYRGFNLVIADNRDAFWLHGRGGTDRHVRAHAIPGGLSMVTAHDLNDTDSPRIAHYRAKFANATAPDPAANSWKSWEALLADRVGNQTYGPTGAMCIETDQGFGTISSSLIALPGINLWPQKPVWRFSAGPPQEDGYKPVAMD